MSDSDFGRSVSQNFNISIKGMLKENSFGRIFYFTNLFSYIFPMNSFRWKITFSFILSSLVFFVDYTTKILYQK